MKFLRFNSVRKSVSIFSVCVHVTMLFCRERMNVPPSLFWKRFAQDSLSTKLKKLATQKKIKSKDQFTPLLDQQPVCYTCSVS